MICESSVFNIYTKPYYASFEAQKSRYKIPKTPYIKTLCHVLDMIEAPFQMLTPLTSELAKLEEL